MHPHPASRPSRPHPFHAGLVALACALPALAQSASQASEPAPLPPSVLRVRSLGNVDSGALSLVRESLRIDLDHQHATTTLSQVWRSAAAIDVEGAYTLHTHPSASVLGYAYWNGEEKIVGEVFEKATAARIYEGVVRLSRDPGLLEESGAGSLTFRVFPIHPAEDKRVEVRLGQRLARIGRRVEYRFPVSAEAQISVELRDPRRLVDLRSATHVLQMVDERRAGGTKLAFHALPRAGTPSPELIFSFEVDEAPLTVDLALHRDAGQDGYAVVSLAVPPLLDKTHAVAKDVTLVIDRSGSMSGQPLDNACAAAAAVVQRLGAEDRVNVITFDTDTDRLYAQPRKVNDQTRAEALGFIRRIGAGGGTDLDRALTLALRSQVRDGQPDVVLFFTDGQSPAQQVLETARSDKGDARVFTLGLGDGVDKALLSRLAAMKRGRFTFIESAAAIEERVGRLFEEIESPVLLDLSVEAEGARLERVYPRTLPDLVPGDELVVHARIVGNGPAHLIVRGTLDGKPVELRRSVELPAQAHSPWVGRAWAKARVDDLLEEIALAGEKSELKDEVTQLGVTYGLVTRYTSFLAIPEREIPEQLRGELAAARAGKQAIFEAHQDAVALSRSTMPPGDPLLTVRAPKDALQVTAYFPFGLVRDLQWDESLEAWTVRFLVPKTVADGTYVAKVVIVHKDGRVELGQGQYVIDSLAPDFELDAERTAAGATLRVRVNERVRRVIAALVKDPRVRVELTSADGVTFTGTLPVPDGKQRIRVVVSDEARNEAEQVIVVAAECRPTAGLSPSPSPSPSPSRPAFTEVFTNTQAVEALAADDTCLWVATRGGVERYDRATLARTRVFTTRDGLDDNHVRAVSVQHGVVEVRTAGSACVLGAVRFVCAPAAPLAMPEPAVARLWLGRRVTAALLLDGRELVGTADGLFRASPAPTRLTPAGDICTNHVMAVAELGARVVLGSFNDGLCVAEGDVFHPVAGAPFRMVNALLATPQGLVVAAAEGLFLTRDLKHFSRVRGAPERGFNGLAFAGGWLYATRPGALHKLSLTGRRGKASWSPGGTLAIVGVAVQKGRWGTDVWLATEDRGAVRLRNGRAQVFDRADGLPASWAMDVLGMPDGGALVATLRDGVVRIDGRGNVRPLAGVPDPWTLRLSREGRDRRALYVGTQGGAVRLEGGGARGGYGRAEAVWAPDARVHVVARAGGALWIGTENGTARIVDQAQADRQTAPTARSAECSAAQRSSTSPVMPIDMRTSPGPMPAAARAASVSSLDVELAEADIRVSA